MLQTLITLEVPRHTMMPGPSLAEPDKILQRLPKRLCRKMFIMLHIPEALRHTMMPGLQPG